jgi:hypothetical protein
MQQFGTMKTVVRMGREEERDDDVVVGLTFQADTSQNSQG